MTGRAISVRSSAFLQEMGVGPRWLLRDRVHAVAEDQSVPVVDEAPAVDAQAEDSVVDSVPELAVPEQAVSAPVAPAPPLRPAAAPVTAPAASNEDTAWFDDAPAPPPKAPVLKQATPPRARAEAPPSGEDTSWFDAVPAMPVPRAPGRTAATDEEIAAMDWPELQAAVRSCTRCRLCETRRAAVPGKGDDTARWLVLGLAPALADEKAEQPFTGPPGQLLQNMLRAVALSTERGAYVTSVVT